MKKIIKSLVLTIVLLLGFITKSQVVNAATLIKTNSNYWFYRVKADGSERHSLQYMLYEIDGEISYCIEPGIPEGNPMYLADWNATGLPNSIKERILLIAYYGYTYPGHQTLKYRAATQGLIWDTIVGGGTNTIFSTERWGAGTLLNVSNEKAEIERLISIHYVKPSFSDEVYDVQIGQTLTLTDTNNVLSQFNVNIDGADYQVNGNTLTVSKNKFRLCASAQEPL